MFTIDVQNGRAPTEGEIAIERDRRTDAVEMAKKDHRASKLRLILFLVLIVPALYFGVLWAGGFERNVFSISSEPLHLTLVLLVWVLLVKLFLTNNEKAVAVEGLERDLVRLTESTEEDCVVILKLLDDPAIQRYRDAVVSQRRRFLKAEVEAMEDWVVQSANRAKKAAREHAVKAVYQGAIPGKGNFSSMPSSTPVR